MDLAEKAREKQGNYENEVTFTGEAGLPINLARCIKHPGHKQFVAVNDFKLKHLPASYQDPALVDLITGLSSITVRLSVKETSHNRPETIPGSDDPYPFYDVRGRNDLTRLGSGWVCCLTMHKAGDNKDCECHSCRTSGTPHKAWGDVRILTAAHVVFDDIESRNTTCHFLYDREEDDINSVPAISCLDIVYCNHVDDMCEMKYITHDLQFLTRLEQLHRGYRNIHKTIRRKYRRSKISSGTDSDHKLTIIVSHPHGCSKQITVGEWTLRQEMVGKNEYTQYIYTTPTCPGSSGAPVYILDMCRKQFWCTHSHCKRCDDDGFNQSSFGYEGS